MLKHNAKEEAKVLLPHMAVAKMLKLLKWWKAKRQKYFKSQCYRIKIFEKKNIFASFLKSAPLLISLDESPANPRKQGKLDILF